MHISIILSRILFSFYYSARLSPEEQEDALKSFERPLNSDVMLQFIRNFLKRNETFV